MMPNGNTLSPSAIARRLVFILLASALAKLIYVFGLTDYSNYIFSDAEHYFHRAQAFYQGKPPYHGDWDVFPMGSSVLLAGYWTALDRLFGLDAHFLESALVLNVLAGTAAVALVWRLAARITTRPRLALLIALAYGFFFPLVYLSAFVVSEHGANLFFLMAVTALVEAWHRKRPMGWLIAAGLCWALACQLRGAYLPCLVGIAALLLWHRHAAPSCSRAKALAGFALGGAAVFLAASLSLWWVSDGESHKPTGSNGGFNFFMQQCHYQGADSRQDGFRWYFYPALYNNQSQLGTFFTSVPFPEQDYFYRAGLGCLAEQPGALRRLVAIAPTMLYSQMFPDLDSAQGHATLMPWMRHLNVLLLLLTPAGYLALQRRQPFAARLLLLNGLLMWATYALINADHRHIYSLSFIYVLFSISGLAALLQRGPRERALYLAGMGAVAGIGIALFTGRGPLALYDNKPETVAARVLQKPVVNGTPWYALEVLRFWAPLTIELGGLQHAGVLRLSLDANDVYALSFLRGDERLGTVRLSLAATVPPRTGMVGRRVSVPSAIATQGYDRLVLTPVSGDNHYGVGDLRLEDPQSPP